MTKRDPRMPRALPPRVEKRPSPDQWSAVEIMTLDEAAHLMWPDGPLTVTSLRTAVRDRQLDIVRVAGKILTCRAALERMLACTSPPSDVPAAEPAPARSGSIAEMQRRYLDRFAK
ncbi:MULTISPECIES: hypothetical protein [unclassified Bradyrhizobium]|uniref:hypothetical protein n=1 Tax=unclassified Bradyrhizobium TaxID=2631580 RepID=UPI003398E853